MHLTFLSPRGGTEPPLFFRNGLQSGLRTHIPTVSASPAAPRDLYVVGRLSRKEEWYERSGRCKFVVR